MSDEVMSDEAQQLCAYLRDRDRCGQGGVEKLVVNRRNDRRVRATVRKSWTADGQSKHSDSEHTLPAGGEEYVGCTASAAGPPVYFSYEVVGCEVL